MESSKLATVEGEEDSSEEEDLVPVVMEYSESERFAGSVAEL